jgi:putative flippase GtrA
MILVAPRLAASLRRRLRSSLGKRFSRFVPVAVASFAASQITLTLLLGPGHATAGISAIAAWFTGAAVSYILSRWAWERKGKPNLVRETLPFWAVSVGAAIVLTLTAKYANHEAMRMGLSHAARVLFVDGAYLAANCVTFLARFVIFHYVLFADRGSSPAAVGATGASGAAGVSDAAGVNGSGVNGSGVNGSGVNGSGAWDRSSAEDGDGEVAGRGVRR